MCLREGRQKQAKGKCLQLAGVQQCSLHKAEGFKKIKISPGLSFFVCLLTYQLTYTAQPQPRLGLMLRTYYSTRLEAHQHTSARSGRIIKSCSKIASTCIKTGFPLLVSFPLFPSGPVERKSEGIGENIKNPKVKGFRLGLRLR